MKNYKVLLSGCIASKLFLYFGFKSSFLLGSVADTELFVHDEKQYLVLNTVHFIILVILITLLLESAQG